MSGFKVFYSWQSDLEGKSTKYFIRGCIDTAIAKVKAESIDAVRDEATRGVTGAPDIVSTLLRKIDDCDLFVADVSLSFSAGSGTQTKQSPNPNVLFELGYAVKTLGWERVICVSNKSFGDSYPFDIEHNRITFYSPAKDGEKNRLVRIIEETIRDLQNCPPRAKEGFAMHLVGSYDFAAKEVVQTLTPIELKSQAQYVAHTNELQEECRRLVDRIQRLTYRPDTGKERASIDVEKDHETSRKSINGRKPSIDDAVRAIDPSFHEIEEAFNWQTKESDRARILKWLGVDADDEFFSLEGLLRVTDSLGFHSPRDRGPDWLKDKRGYLKDLSENLQLLELREEYLRSFDGLFYIPLAIRNISRISDTKLRVVIEVDVGEAVCPSEDLFVSDWARRDDEMDLLGSNGDGEDYGVVAELFTPPTDSMIQIDEPSEIFGEEYDLPYGIEGNVFELRDYIASPTENGTYVFDIEELRASEAKWMNKGILVKTTEDELCIGYQITSMRTDGEIKGKLLMQDKSLDDVR